MRHYFVVKLFLTGFCFSALIPSLWLVAQPATYLRQGLQTVERVPDDILPETMARLPQVSRDVVAQPGSGKSNIRCSPACEIRDEKGSAPYGVDYFNNRARN